MLKILSFLIKFIVLLTVGTIALGSLEIIALVFWKAKFMAMASQLSDDLTDELKWKNL